jgi:hypothetical protein
MGLIAAIAFWMPNCSPHSLHETISVFGRWATSLWLSFTATGHRCSPGLNVFLYSRGISSITLAAVKCYWSHLLLLKFLKRIPHIVTTPPITMAQGNEDRARMSLLTWSSEHPPAWAEPTPEKSCRKVGSCPFAVTENPVSQDSRCLLWNPSNHFCVLLVLSVSVGSLCGPTTSLD